MPGLVIEIFQFRDPGDSSLGVVNGQLNLASGCAALNVVKVDGLQFGDRGIVLSNLVLDERRP